MKIRITCLVVAALSLSAQEPAKPAQSQGLPPRATPADYQAQTKAGNYTIAAEFAGHGIPTSDGALTTDDYVVVEVALFGPPNAKLQLSPADFSLRINGKKAPAPGLPAVAILESVKDPEWAPPEKSPEKSKTSFGSGKGGGAADGPPAPVKVPIEVQRALGQRVKKLSLAEGERPLPQAGLVFFQFNGKTKNIHSIELIYSGPAGQATLTLQP
jgi:hypothetical protein